MPLLDLTIGQIATRSNTITAAHVEQYAAMTGDRNPLHFDADYARRTPFCRVIVHASKPICTLAATIVRQDGETVLTGRTTCYRMLPR